LFSPKFSLVDRTSSRVVSIYMGSAVAVSGIHAVGPGIPELQKHFGVSENQALWSISFYLFPGMIAAIPLGRLADRVGRRHLYAVCLAVFGFMSLLVPLAGYSWPLFLGIRLVQGIAFAGIIPLSIVLISDQGSRETLMRRQGHRSVVQQVADTVHPILGGILVVAAWHAPYLIGAATIPVAILLLTGMRDVKEVETSVKSKVKQKIQYTKQLNALIFGGFVRFFIKFIPLSSLGVLLINTHDQPVVLTGFIIASLSLSGALGAISVNIGNRIFSASMMSHVTVFLIGLSLIIIAISDNIIIIVLAITLFGVSDGLFGTIQNSYVSVAAPSQLQGTLSGTVAMARNIGKFLAPLFTAMIISIVNLRGAFFVAGLLAMLSLVLLLPLNKYDHHFKEA
jgi:MFS transporter, ACDE family, multidrug resistance protein